MAVARQGTQTTLLQLLPTYNTSTLPTSLVNLATSLYASSRARAPVLKREEEIARDYACVVLAIERLKSKLNLPDIERRPPCPPRAFAKLLKFFNEILPSSSSNVVVIASNKRAIDDRGASVRTPSKQMSSMEKPFSSTQGSNKKRKLVNNAENDPSPNSNDNPTEQDRTPTWLPAFLGDVCPLLAPPQGFTEAVTAGAVTLCPKATSSDSQTSTPSKKALLAQQRAPAIVVALVLLILEGLGQQINIRDTAKTAVKELIVRRVITMIQFGKVVAEAEALLEERGPAWRKMEWYGDAIAKHASAEETHDQSQDEVEADAAALVQVNAVESSDDADMEDAQEELHEEDEEVGEESQEQIERPMPRGGLSTMLQPRVDWLSPERRQHYVGWKEQMMQKIEVMEQQLGNA